MKPNQNRINVEKRNPETKMTLTKIICLAALAASLFLAGCATRTAMTSNGLPPDKFLIGGGFKIDWTAPTDGTFIVAEQNTGKILVTESATEDEDVQFTIGDDEDLATLEKMIGLPMKDVRIQAYWIPAKTKLKTTAE
jgi:hypothetical protein